MLKKTTPAEQIVTAVPRPSSDWREPFIKCLTSANVPDDNTERERLTHHNKHYVLVEGKLYRKNTKGELLQKCVSMEEGKNILKEIHAGTCGNHAASRTLVEKAF